MVAATDLIEVDAQVLDLAGRLPPESLRSLDALHLASALSVWRVDGFLTYDLRLAEAAAGHGLRVLTPGRPA